MTEDTNDTMADVDHTHPHTGRAFGEGQVFERGPVVAADGGDAGAVPDSDATDEETMADVDHEHPHDGDARTRTFERGNETAAETQSGDTV
jgi:hypothetical protein